MPTGDYQKYMPKFTGAGEYTAEEHIEAFYAYAENINISEEDVWTRVLFRVWMAKPESGSKSYQQIQSLALNN
jgi:hypothetical protein